MDASPSGIGLRYPDSLVGSVSNMEEARIASIKSMITLCNRLDCTSVVWPMWPIKDPK